MPTQYEIRKAYRETWAAADRLREKYPEVWFFNVNRGRVMLKNPKRTTFAFDYAVACSRKEAEKIAKLIRAYRNAPLKNLADYLERVDRYIRRFPYVVGFWL